jgi:riboflavin biosynthesis pyrimidine reductase
VRAEGYGRLVTVPERVARRRARGQADTPLAVLLSRSLDVPWDAGLFAAPDQPVLIYTAERRTSEPIVDEAPIASAGDVPATGAGGAAATSAGGAPPAHATPSPQPPLELAAPVEIVALPDPSPAAALADLRRRGVQALLCEGGPTLNRSLFAAGLVDELFLTLTPLITADNAQVRLLEGVALPQAAELSLLWSLRRDDELFLRYAIGHGG